MKINLEMIVMSNAINILTSILTEANWFLGEMANILRMSLYLFMAFGITLIPRHTHISSSFLSQHIPRVQPSQGNTHPHFCFCEG